MRQYSTEELKKMTKDDLIAIIESAQEEDAFRKARTREQGKKYRNRAKEKQSALEAEVARLRALTSEAPKQ